MAGAPGSTPGDWATEATLKRLADLTTTGNRYLLKMAEGKDSIDQAVAETTEELERLTSAVGRAKAEEILKLEKSRRTREGEERLNRLREDANYSYVKSVNVLKSSLSMTSTAMSGSSTAITSFLSTVVDKFADKLSGMGKLGALAGAGLSAVSAVAGYTVAKLVETRDAYTDMIQSGLFFEGNLLQFGADIRKTGLTVSEFSGIVERHGTSIFAVGERAFLGSVNQLGKTFDKFGLSIKAGTEEYAEYLDTLRASSSLYFMTTAQQEEAFKKNITQQTEMARLNGITVKQQKEEQRKLQEKASYKAIMASMTPEKRAAMEDTRTKLLGKGFSVEDVEALIMFKETGGAKRGGPIAGIQGAAPQAFDQLVASMGQMGETMDQALSVYGKEAVGGLMSNGRQMAVQSYYGSGMGQDINNTMIRIATAMEAGVLGAPRTQMGPEGPMDQASRDVFTATREFAVAMGTLDSAAMRMASDGIGYLDKAIRGLAETLKGTTFQDISNYAKNAAIISTAAAGVSTLAGPAITAASALRGGRKIPTPYGPPAPPPAAMTAGEAAGAAAKKTLGRTIPLLGDILLGLDYGMETGSIGRGITAGLGSFGGRIAGGAAMGAAGTVVPVAGTAAGLVAGEIAGGYGGAYAGAKAWDNVTSWFSGPPPSAEAAQQTADAVDPLEGLLKELGKKLDTLIVTTAYVGEILETGNKKDDDMHNRLGNILKAIKESN